MRLIDADELIEVLNEHGYSTDDYEDDSYDMGVVVGFNNGMIHARHHAHYAKTIDAEPVRHGHWIELWFDEEDRLLGELPSDYKCSVCGGIVPRKTFQSGRYCPNCGAKMDEENNT